LELPMTGCDGLFAQALIDVIQARQLLTFNVEHFNRAVLRPGLDAQAYIQTALGPKHRRELQARAAASGRLGRLTSRVLEPDDDPEPWIEHSCNWKPAAGKARSRPRSIVPAASAFTLRRSRVRHTRAASS